VPTYKQAEYVAQYFHDHIWNNATTGEEDLETAHIHNTARPLDKKWFVSGESQWFLNAARAVLNVERMRHLFREWNWRSQLFTAAISYHADLPQPDGMEHWSFYFEIEEAPNNLKEKSPGARRYTYRSCYKF